MKLAQEMGGFFVKFVTIFLVGMVIGCGSSESKSIAYPNKKADKDLQFSTNETKNETKKDETDSDIQKKMLERELMNHPLYNQVVEVHNLLGSKVLDNKDLKLKDFDQVDTAKNISNQHKNSEKTEENIDEDLEEHNFAHCIVGDKPTINILDGNIALSSGEDLFVPDGQTVSWKYTSIESRNQMRDFFNIKLGAKASFLFNSTTAKAHADYFQKASFTESEIYHAASVEIKNPAVYMQNIKLSPGAYRLIKKKGLKAFYDRCGKEAVVGYHTGGFARVIMKIGLTESAKQSDATIGAQFKTRGFLLDAQGKIDISLGEFSKDSKVYMNIEGIYQGGIGEGVALSEEQIKNLLHRWPATVAKHPVVTDMIKKPYHQLVSTVVDPQRELIEKEISMFIKHLDKMLSLRDALLNHATYKKYKTSDLLKKQKGLNGKSNMDIIDDFIKQLSNAINKCRKSLQLKNCTNSKLLSQANAFRVKVLRKHKSCNTKTIKVKAPDEERCTTKQETYYENCGVKAYNWGDYDSTMVTRWSDEMNFSKKSYSQSCRVSTVRRRWEVVKTLDEITRCAEYGNFGDPEVSTIMYDGSKVNVSYKNSKTQVDEPNGLVLASRSLGVGGMHNDFRPKFDLPCIRYETSYKYRVRLYCEKRDPIFGVESYQQCERTRDVRQCKMVKTHKTKTVMGTCSAPI